MQDVTISKLYEDCLFVLVPETDEQKMIKLKLDTVHQHSAQQEPRSSQLYTP